MSEGEEGAQRRRPRLQDIAIATGLSIKTVSRAVRGEGPMNPETRKRVLAEANRIGFRFNDIAAGLRRKDQLMTTIGVTLGDSANPFFAPLLRGIHSVAADHRYLVLSSDAQNDGDLEEQAIRSLFAHRVAGLIIAPVGQDLGYLDEDVAFGASIVFVDSPPPGLEGRVDSVTTTNTESTRKAVAMLLRRGHRRIGFLGHPRAGSGALERWNGYRMALEDANVPLDMRLVRDGLVTEDDGRRAAETLDIGGPDPVTAIFCDNNRLSMGLLLSERLGDGTADIVSFDDFPLAKRFGISVIDSRPMDVGQAGARLLFDRLVEPSRPPTQVVVPASFHERRRRQG